MIYGRNSVGFSKTTLQQTISDTDDYDKGTTRTVHNFHIAIEVTRGP